MPINEPSHGDILVQIGELKGQVQTLITLVGQKREDINAVFARVGALEKDAASHVEVDRVSTRIGVVERELAKWAGICLGVAVLMPLVMPKLQSAIEAAERPPLQAPPATQPRRP